MNQSPTALLMSFSAWLMARYRLDVSAQASEFMASHLPTVSLADYAGLPVELIGKLRRDGNPAEFLTMHDLQLLERWIMSQRNVTRGLECRVSRLLEERAALVAAIEQMKKNGGTSHAS